MVQYETLIPYMWGANSAACFICAIFTIIAIYYQCCKKPDPKQNQELLSVKYSATIAMILFTITCGIQNMTVSYLTYSMGFQVFQIITQFFWIMAQASCCFMFMSRLKQTFQNTKYQLTKTTISIFYGALIIFILLNFAIWALFEIIYNTSHISDSTAFRINAILLTIANVLDFGIGSWIVYSYSAKLLQCMQQFNDDLQQNIAVVAMSDRSDSIHLSSTQRIILTIMTKLSLISFLAIGATQIYLISELILYSLVDLRDKGNSFYLLWYSITIILQSFCSAMNVICIFVSLEFAEPFYGKVCCKAHSCCGKVCNFYAKRKMKQVVEMNFYHKIDTDYMQYDTDEY